MKIGYQSYYYASLWRRTAAFLMDTLFINGCLLLVQILCYLLEYDLLATPWAGLGTLLFTWIYFAGSECSTSQASLGKWLMGMKVTTIDGFPPSFLRATGRYLGLGLTAATGLLGFLSAMAMPHKQAIHDWLTYTVVIIKV